MTAEPDGSVALDELYWRAEILQALYWMRGEGLANEVTAAALAEFLGADPAGLANQLECLVETGYLERVGRAEARAYCLSTLGVQEGGRSFHDEFADYLRQAHGECGPGCWCKDPDHEGEPCPNEPKREAERVSG